MNRISIRLLSVLAIFLFIAVLPIAVFATNEDVSIVSTINNESKTEYIIYIKDYSNKTFKYAFTNKANPDEMDLYYINSNPDLGDETNQVALLSANTYEKFKNQQIYFWAKDQNENLILKGIQLDLDKSLTDKEINNVETLTKRIEVKITDNQQDTTTIRNEKVDGIDEVANVGYVKILEEDKNATYYYNRVNSSESEKYTELIKLAEQIKNEYEKMNMYEKMQFCTKFNNLYSELIDEMNWDKVKKMTIEQPEESKDGDKYIVFLKKVNKNGAETIDVQFLTAFENYEPNVVIEEVVTQETTKLPITYDSIALFVLLGIIIVLVITVFIKMKKLEKQNEEK